jgi:hypothetical protein
MAKMKNDGLETLAKRVISNTPAAFTYGAWSTNTDAEVATGTTLTGEIASPDGLARAGMTCTNPSTYVTQWYLVWTATSNKTVTKFGIFNASSAGNILVEHLLPVARVMAADDTISMTAQMTTYEG